MLRKTPFKALLFATVLIAPLLASPSAAEAQWRRGPRVVVVGGPVFSHYYYDPFFFYDPFFAPQWYPYPYPAPFPYRRYDDSASVRVQVKPKDAEVYVDSYYAGLVDDFDGVFQRLNLPPGQHDIEIHKDGFKSVRQQIYLSPRSTYKLHYDMQPLAPGEMADPRPMPPAAPPGAQGEPGQYGPPQYGPPGQPGPPPQRMPPGRRMPPPPPPAPQNPPQGPGDASRFGTLIIRVQPGSADITIDGERWRGPEGQDRLIVQLTEGSHRVEIHKDGYERFSSEVQVRRGETTPLNVSLPPTRQ